MAEQNDLFDFRAYFASLWRLKFVGIGVIALAALITYVYGRLQQPVYQASAVLVVQASKVTADFLPAALTIDSCKQIAESDALKAEASAAVHAVSGFADASLTFLPVETVSPTPAAGDLLRLKAEALSPRTAEMAANAWMDATVKQLGMVSTKSRTTAMDSIEQHFLVAESSLKAAEAESQDVEEKVRRELGSSKMRLQSERAVKRVDLGIADLANLQSRRTDLQLQQRRVEQALAEAERLLAQQPAKVIVTRSLSDDALLQVGGDAATQGSPGRVKLQNEVPNPLSVDLQSRVLDQHIVLEGLKSEIAAIGAELAQRQTQLTTEQDAADARTEANDLLERKGKSRIEATERGLADLREDYKTWKGRVDVVRLARVSLAEEVRVATRAGIPAAPIGPKPLETATRAAAVALILSLAAVFFNQVIFGTAVKAQDISDSRELDKTGQVHERGRDSA